MSVGGRRGHLVFLALLLLFAVPLGLLGLLASESGSAWLLRQAGVLARPAGIELGFRQSAGSLLRRVELSGLVFAGSDTQVEIDTLVLDWRPRALLERRLQVRALEVRGVRVVPPPAESTESEPLQVPDLALPVVLQIDGLLVQDLRIEQPDGTILVDHVALTAALDSADLRLDDLQVRAQGVHLDGMLAMQAMAPHGLDGRLQVRLDEQLVGADIGPLTARAELAGEALHPAFDVWLETPAELQFHGGLALASGQPHFDVTADWERIVWPPRGAPGVIAESGRANLRGGLDDYRLNLKAALRRAGLPAAQLAVEARGDLGRLELQPLSLQLGTGHLQAIGGLRWDSGLHGQLQLRAAAVNPALLLPDWPGEIDAQIDLAVDRQAGSQGIEVNAEIAELGGSLRGYPLHAGGAIHWMERGLEVQALRIQSGDNQIDVDGRLRLDDSSDRTSNLRLAISAPDLAAFSPDLRGGLEGGGRIGGTPTRPVLAVSLSGNGLGYQDLGARSFVLDLDWTGEDGQATVRLADLDLAGFALSSAAADLSGSQAAHRLGLQVAAPELSFDLAATGGWGDEVWRGVVQRLSLTQAALGEWRLAAATTLAVGPEWIQSEPLCLHHDRSRLCGGGTWGAHQGLELSASLVDLDLARLAPLIPGDASIQGLLGAEFAVTGSPMAPQITFDLRPSDGSIQFDQDGQLLEIAYGDAQVAGRFADDRGSAELHLALGGNGRAEGHFALGPMQGGRRALVGQLEADFPDLELIEGFVPALQAVQGQLAIDAALGGTLDQPRLAGSLVVSQASARLPDAGIVLQDIGLRISGDQGDPLQVEAWAESGSGRLQVEGEADPFAAGGVAVELALRGTDFEALRLPEAQVVLAPDLMLHGRGPYHLSGTLRIPKATVEVKELPQGTVAVSPDEILVDAQDGGAARRDNAAGRDLTADVRVELGKSVTFKGFGLSTGLAGALRARAGPDSTTLDGVIELRDGRYKAYGQDLSVESGRLLFAGVPDNPAIDLRAKRVSRDAAVTAYLALSGPLAKPQARVYSQPRLPEAEALAYLITGRSLDRAGRGEGADIAGAALALGMTKGEPLLQQLGDRLGLDELRVESGQEGFESSSLVLGQYLNPDLYLGYSQGLFSPEGAILLRLRLSEQLELESRSGNEQSVDLLYRIEHD